MPAGPPPGSVDLGWQADVESGWEAGVDPGGTVNTVSTPSHLNDVPEQPQQSIWSKLRSWTFSAPQPGDADWVPPSAQELIVMAPHRRREAEEQIRKHEEKRMSVQRSVWQRLNVTAQAAPIPDGQAQGKSQGGKSQGQAQDQLAPHRRRDVTSPQAGNAVPALPKV